MILRYLPNDLTIGYLWFLGKIFSVIFFPIESVNGPMALFIFSGYEVYRNLSYLNLFKWRTGHVICIHKKIFKEYRIVLKLIDDSWWTWSNSVVTITKIIRENTLVATGMNTPPFYIRNISKELIDWLFLRFTIHLQVI